MNVFRGKSKEIFQLFTNTLVFSVSVSDYDYNEKVFVFNLIYFIKYKFKAFYRYIYHVCDLYSYRFYFRQVAIIEKAILIKHEL